MVVHASRIANHRGSVSSSRPFVQAQIAPMASVTTASTFDWIVKKLRKLAITVGTWPP